MAKTAPFDENVDRYELWFERYPNAYQAELRAVAQLLPKEGIGLDIGTGTGRFSSPIGISVGVEPSIVMARVALTRNIDVVRGVAEDLPIKTEVFDFVLMVTTVCFLDDVNLSFREAFRVLRQGGVFVTGFVDRLSPLGQSYLLHKNENVFYKSATFYTVKEIVNSLNEAGFKNFQYRQTIFKNLSETSPNEPVRQGYGDGAFVVVRAEKAKG